MNEQQKLISERNYMYDNLCKLDNLINSKETNDGSLVFDGFSDDAKLIIKIQYAVSEMYIDILDARIEMLNA